MLYQLIRTLKLIARFYAGIFLANLLVTLVCMWLIIFYGNSVHLVITGIFWFKVITIPMIFYLNLHYKQKELYYYRNLGVSKLMLVVVTSVFDLLLFVIMLIITNRIK